MVRGRWRSAVSALLRVIAVRAVSTLTMLVLAGILPDFQLQDDDGDSITRVALTAVWGAGAFGLLGALVWPLAVRALLLVPALVVGLLAFFLNGSLLLVALSLIPDGRGEADPETRGRRRRHVRRRVGHLRSARVRDDDAYGAGSTGSPTAATGGPATTGATGCPARSSCNSTASAREALREAVADGLMPTVAAWLGATSPPTG